MKNKRIWYSNKSIAHVIDKNNVFYVSEYLRKFQYKIVKLINYVCGIIIIMYYVCVWMCRALFRARNLSGNRLRSNSSMQYTRI